MLIEDRVLIVLQDQIRERLDLSNSITNDNLMECIENAVFTFSEEHYLSAADKKAYVERIFDAYRGLDVLQPLMDNKEITEIMVNQYDEIFIEQSGRVTRYPHKFLNQERFEDLIQMIVSKVNRVVNESTPIVDARLPDGSRVSVILPPIALKGPALSIRKFSDKPMTLAELMEKGAMPLQAKEWLENVVAAKYNIFISGGTGSGKTTLLNALAQCIPKDERIITIEDSAELQIHSIDNVVRLETRNANTEGRGEIGIRELIKSALRMRPNRIIVGEVRGAEALDMLQAMNTGHEGSISTGHANSIYDMLSRLETMVLSGAPLPIEVIRKQMSSAIDYMIHLSRTKDGSRKIIEICEVAGMNEGEISLRTIYKLQDDDLGVKRCPQENFQ